MSPLPTSESGVRPSDFRFRCIDCGDLSDSASPDYRCPRCGDLLEISYPKWNKSGINSRASGVRANHLKSTWKQRRLSAAPADLSGVWRFPELLPALNDGHVITLRDGRPPLYRFPHSPR